MSEVESYSVYSSEDECGDGQEPKMFEPDPRLIARLYCEIKKNKTLSLDWKCEGRITLAEYEQVYKSENLEMETDPTESDSKEHSGFNDFDFDEDPMETSLKQSPLIKKKATQAPKKVTNLDKVIGDIKKYQKSGKQKDEV